MWLVVLVLGLATAVRSVPATTAATTDAARLLDKRHVNVVTVKIEEQPQPENCSQFLDSLEILVNETSYGLFTLTEERTFFTQVHIQLPASWDRNRCQRGSVERTQITKADVHIGPAELFPGGQPWTEQAAGCGLPGQRVHVPTSFLRRGSGPSSGLMTKGNLLLREWCKLRYGVFPESGFVAGDPLYPHVYTEANETLVNAGCANDVPFCPASAPYNRRAPTKQNLLCHGESALETILKHFSPTVPKLAYEEPRFAYAVPRKARFVLALERTAVMGVSGRWSHLKRALLRFLNYLPVGSEVSLVSFGKEAVVHLPLTTVTDSNRDGLHGRIPRQVLDESLACVFCAVNASLAALGSEGGALVLITGSRRRPHQMDGLVRAVAASGVQTFPVAYPTTAYPGLLELATPGGRGRHYAVPEGPSVDSLAYLSEVLLDLLRFSGAVPIQKVHEARHDEAEFAGTFTLESSMQHGLSVTLNIDDEDKVESFELTSPEGEKHLFSRFEDGMVVLSPPRGTPGIWTYHAKLFASQLPGESVVDVVSQGSHASARPFTLRVFSSAEGRQVDVRADSVVLYARLTQGDAMPVLGAQVAARVFLPGDNGTFVDLAMRDNGAGDPDITAGDGIYSAYFTAFAAAPGFYAVQVSADHNNGQARTLRPAAAPGQANNCCGSRLRGSLDASAPAPPFQRQSAGPAFYVREGVAAGADVSPPSRVLDLRVAQVVPDSLFVQLEWSAPGGDLDRGRAASYEIRCYTSLAALQRAFDTAGILVHASFLPKPLPYGQSQSCTVGVPWPNEVFYYALVATDAAGNRGPISNVLSVYIPEATTTTPPTTSTADASLGTLLLGPGSQPSEARSEQLKLLVAVATISGLLVVLGLVVALILVRGRRSQLQYDASEKDTYKAYEPEDPTVSKSQLPGSAPAGAGGKRKPSEVGHQIKTLSHWLDSLPRSEGSPNSTSHDISATGSTLGRKHHTLTKTNPYRHKVLTNGSFLNLKDIPSPSSHLPLPPSAGAASEDSSRPTTSTEDNGSSSGHSGGSSDSGDFGLHGHGNSGQSGRLKRSNTASECVGAGAGASASARAIIDTYSGSSYTSDRRLLQRRLHLEQQSSVLVDRDSLEPSVVVLPVPQAHPAEDVFSAHRTSRHSLRLRTESVV